MEYPVFEAAPDAMFLSDERGLIVLCNPAACALFRLTREELVGRPVSDFIRSDAIRELELTVKDGETRWVEHVSVANVPPGLSLSVLRDITENRRLRTELEEALKQRDDFLATVSHDLRNPLSTITMSVGLLRRLAEGDKAVRALDNISRAADRMTRLITDLLDASRLESGRVQIDKKPVDVRSLLIESCEGVQLQASQRGLKLEPVAEAGLMVACDRERIIQVLTNLLTNAIRFTRTRVTVEAKAVAAGVRFAVTDDGPGIPPDQLPHLFERYWQADPRERKGLGLGLAIAKGLVDAHGGTIGADSQVGVGSTFWVELA